MFLRELRTFQTPALLFRLPREYGKSVGKIMFAGFFTPEINSGRLVPLSDPHFLLHTFFFYLQPLPHPRLFARPLRLLRPPLT